VDDSRTGLTVPPEDPARLAEALCRLIVFPQERRDMGMQAREHVVREFSLQSCAEKLETIYTSVLTKYCRMP
jgi:glycosyltransferase involved in cell wall biosynthesis